MKITKITANSRKKSFAIHANRGEYVFPYAKLQRRPTKDDPMEEVFADPEIGNEAFTYRLRSGAEDAVHLDEVREFARDPDYLQERLPHDLTLEARRGLDESGLGKRQVSRLLGTSPSQLYRLLDPTNQSKSIGHMLALLHLVDREVRLVVTDKDSPQARRNPRAQQVDPSTPHLQGQELIPVAAPRLFLIGTLTDGRYPTRSR